MVESAGALGQPPAPSRRRGELFPQRAARRGREPWLPEAQE